MARDALGFESKKIDGKSKWRNRYYIIRILLVLLAMAISAGIGAAVGSSNGKDYTDNEIAEIEQTISELEIPPPYDDSLVVQLKETVAVQAQTIESQEFRLRELIGEYDKLAAEYYRHLEIYHSLYVEKAE